jgi:hypothetical protein
LTADGVPYHFLLMIETLLMAVIGAIVVGGAASSYLEAARGKTAVAATATLILGSTPDQDAGHRRRRAAKQWNERLKLAATFCNGFGLALFVAFAITRPRGGASLKGEALATGLISAGAFLIIGLIILSFWKSEE